MIIKQRHVLGWWGIFVFLLIYSGCYGRQFWGAEKEQRVFDQAGLLEETQIVWLEEQIDKLCQQINMDLILVTTENTKGMSSEQFADQFYISGKFGIGSDASGALFLIDMDNSEIYVNASGKMIRILTDQRQSDLLAAAYEKIMEADYQQTMVEFLNHIEVYTREGVVSGQYNYDRDHMEAVNRGRQITPLEAGIAVVIAFVCGILPCLAVKRQYGMKRDRTVAANSRLAYRANAEYNFSTKQDHCIGTKVHHRHIPRSSGGGGTGKGGSTAGRSTTHSTSGRTFSGSGKKF